MAYGTFVMGPFMMGPFMMGPFVMGPFVMGSLVMSPYVGELLKHALSITNKKWSIEIPAM
jgi:hypothetical protein